MKTYFKDENITLYNCDVMDGLKLLEPESVQCVVTSPPYWGLRDYGTAQWEGGEINCDHSTARSRGDDIKLTDKQGTSAGSRPNIQIQCKCGAKRIDKQFGLEKTPEEYVEKMVLIFREIKRVLKDDGIIWVNMGDSYYNYRPGARTSQEKQSLAKHNGAVVEESAKRKTKLNGLKEKDLMGMPWMVAFALRSDGWYLRSEIIWHKLNPMPESVTDRPTKSHEQIFLLSKSQKYFYDADAIREPVSPNTHLRLSQDEEKKIASQRAKYKTPDGWDTSRGNGGHGSFHKQGREQGKINNKNFDPGKGNKYNLSFDSAVCLPVENRNKRTVWSIATAPYKDAHFATFPPKLIEPCILAGSAPGDTILDPFWGSGTTGQVARDHGRNVIGIELNPDYCEMSLKRFKQKVLQF